MPYTDGITRGLLAVDYVHHEIHEGDAFVAAYGQDVAGSGELNILLTTPDTAKYAHCVLQVVTESEAHVYLYENPTISAAGTAVPSYNRNRNSATVAGLTITHTPTVTATGAVILLEQHFGSGKGVGGNERGAEEWILKRNEQTLIRVTNMTASNNQIWVTINWYEHTNVA